VSSQAQDVVKERKTQWAQNGIACYKNPGARKTDIVRIFGLQAREHPSDQRSHSSKQRSAPLIEVLHMKMDWSHAGNIDLIHIKPWRDFAHLQV